MSLKVLYAYKDKLPEDYVALVHTTLRAAFGEPDTILFSAGAGAWREKLARADAALFTPSTFLSDVVLENARHLKLIQLLSSGYDKFNTPACKRLGIPLANNCGENADAVAEHTLLLMLAVLRSLVPYHHRMQKGMWKGWRFGMETRTLKECTVGIVGYGNIGKEVAKKVTALGARVLAFDKRVLAGVEQVGLPVLLAQSDIVTLHLRPGEGTDGIIGEHEFALMKERAILINTARPSLVNEAAFLHAIKSGKLFGAGVDVWTNKRTSPLLGLPVAANVVTTPHVAGAVRSAYADSVAFAVENFKRVARGEIPHGLI